MPYRLLVGRDLDHLCVLWGGAISLVSSLCWTVVCCLVPACAGHFRHLRGELQSTLCLGKRLLHALSLVLESAMGCVGKAGCRDSDCILGFSFP